MEKTIAARQNGINAEREGKQRQQSQVKPLSTQRREYD